MTRLAALLTLTAFAVAPASALAQAAPPLDEFSALRFSPAPGARNYLATEGATLPAHLTPSVGLVLDYANDPFVLYNATCQPDDVTNCETTGVERHLLHHSLTGHLFGTIALFDRLQVGLVLPLAYATGQSFAYTTGMGTFAELSGGKAFGLGDPRLTIKGLLFGEGIDGLHFAASAFVTAPVGQLTAEDRYIGEDTVTAGGYFIGEFVQRGFHIAANAGAIYRPRRVLFSTEVGSQLSYRVALGYDVTPLIMVFAEVEGGSTFTLQVDENPMEARLAGRYSVGDFAFTLGGGAGVVSGVGVPVFRVLAGAAWAPVRSDSDGDGIDDADDGCPTEVEDIDGYLDEDGCPDTDNDADGLLDGADRCPDEAEDMDRHEDEDGCPDLDNDGDGVQDGYDSCPDEAEDMDGDRDEDGCPDHDRDRDGINDDVDVCPDQPEDTDGFGDDDGCPEDDFDGDGIPDDSDECPDQPEMINGVSDQDGCPEEDSDGDGIPDEADRCPNEPETMNGRADTDGCPDGEVLVRVEGERIVLLEQVQFRTASANIRGRLSSMILDAVATILQRNPQYRRVRVEGHTDDRGAAEGNRRLSLQRAQACVDYLTGHGVAAGRLHAEGLGPDRPLGSNETPEGRESNRRVEFHIEPVTPGAAAAPAAPAAPAADAEPTE